MNKGKLSGLKGKHVRLRPVHRRFDRQSGSAIELPPTDNEWFVADAGRGGVVIRNAGYGHTLNLAADQIRDFRTDPSGKSFGFLNLNGQVWVCGREAGVEPFRGRLT